jgi:hypothetical protein
MNKILFFIFIITICSCKIKDNSEEFKQKIIGEWFYVKKSPHYDNHNASLGYTFISKTEVDFKSGFYNDSKGKDEYIRQFIGERTKYAIVDDTLKVFSLSDNAWHNRKIIFISEDTLAFQGECFTFDKNDAFCFEKYARHSKKLDNQLQFDKISLTSSGCYGSCPILKINLHSSGTVEFYCKRFTLKKGYFTAKISDKKFTELANNFRKVNFSTLKDNYEAEHTDDNTITISFWQGDKIVKTVRDYGRVSPSAFVYAYSQLRFLDQQIPLIQIDEKIGKTIFTDDFR